MIKKIISMEHCLGLQNLTFKSIAKESFGTE